MGARVIGIDATGVDVADGEGHTTRLATYTTVWAAGVEASPLATELAKATGAELDRAGRIAVRPDCSVPGHPEVFVVGDMMALNNLPGVAEVAMQGGLHAANTILRGTKGEPSVPFKYRDLGSAAAVGRFRAVVNFHGLRLSGFPGWVVWAFVHLTFLTGFGNRLTTLLDWTRSFIGKGRPEREFSVMHTGGYLSTPSEVRSIIQPNPLPASTPNLFPAKRDRSRSKHTPGTKPSASAHPTALSRVHTGSRMQIPAACPISYPARWEGPVQYLAGRLLSMARTGAA